MRLDAWLDTMRSAAGYGGPVVHWWQDCLQFTGPAFDWRYEGIIFGYLNLYARTSDDHWLDKARRAGDDVVNGQFVTGNFRCSSFELNPLAGGAPHEAAVDLALLTLARVLRELGSEDWERYTLVAERNLRRYHIDKLWNAELPGFGNSAQDPTFTPNKSATIAEALFALAAIREDEELVERYALPTLDTVLRHQVIERDHPLCGAIDQSSSAGKQSRRFFPFYIARCIPGLLQAHTHTGCERYREGARRAMSFILRHRLPDGSFPQVIYGNGRMNRYPQWIAGVGDVLRAMQLLSEVGIDIPPGATLDWMLRGQDGSGAIRTAHGFASQASQRKPAQLSDFRDVLPVCGWVDKAFRYLTTLVDGAALCSTPTGVTELRCGVRGRVGKYYEDAMTMELSVGGPIVYRWRKALAWAERRLTAAGAYLW